MCLDNDDVPCVFSLPACYWCFLLPYLPANTRSAPDSQQSPLWLVYVRQPITSNVVVRCDHHYLLREDRHAGQLSFSAPSLLEASLKQIKSMLRLLEQNGGTLEGPQRWHMTWNTVAKGGNFLIYTNKQKKPQSTWPAASSYILLMVVISSHYCASVIGTVL